MKKNIFITLSIIIALSFIKSAYASETLVDSGTCGTNLTWSIYDNGLLIIDGNGIMDNYDPYFGSDRPWHGYKDTIKSVKVENGITEIDVSAFCNLTSLETIYWNVTDCTIRFTYYGNQSLFDSTTKADELTVVFGSNVENIPTSIFSSCTKLKSIMIPNSVTSIENSAFSDCTELKTIKIPNSVTTIGNSAFSGCTSLTSITIPDSVSSMGSSVFMNCENLNRVVLGSGLKTINKYAFRNCSALNYISIPETVKSIETEAFRNCQSLETIAIQNTDAIIAKNAFYNCGNLTDAYYSGNSSDWLKTNLDKQNALRTATIHYSCSLIDYKSYSDIEKCTFIVALYDDGKMIDFAITKNISISLGENTILSPINNFNNADTAKLFAWDNMLCLAPLSNLSIYIPSTSN